MNLLIFIVFGLFNRCTCDTTGIRMKLEFIQIIFRHGARTPSESEAKYVGVTNSSFYGKRGFNQLKNEGKMQVYTLGCLLRKRYDEFIGVYNLKELEALSTKFGRTTTSLQLVLAGLYPPTSEERWNKHLDWHPIPFSHTPASKDVTLTPHQYPNYKEVHNDAISKSEDYQSRISKYSEILKFVSEKSGIAFQSDLLYHTGFSYYVINYHKKMNLPLPDWCTDYIATALKELLEICLDSMSLTQKLKKLNGGTLVRKIIENIYTNKNSSEPKKIYLYSTHDLTLAGFTRAVNVETFKVPPLGSAIIVEMYRDDQNDEYIKMLSWDGTKDNFEVLKIGDCISEYCPLARFIQLTEAIIPTDEDLDFLVGK